MSADRKKTSIGPGNRWADVYTKLDAQGLAVPGGRFGTVGVGGLVTGGGVSFFSGRYGFVCDSVVNYELVLPYGKVVNVNALSSPDLFKALKGGSNNFGVVTRFDIKSFESGRFWGGEIIYPISTMPQQISAFVGLGTCEHPPSFAKDSSSQSDFASFSAFSDHSTENITTNVMNSECQTLRSIRSPHPQLCLQSRRMVHLEQLRIHQDPRTTLPSRFQALHRHPTPNPQHHARLQLNRFHHRARHRQPPGQTSPLHHLLTRPLRSPPHPNLPNRRHRPPAHQTRSRPRLLPNLPAPPHRHHDQSRKRQ